MKTPVAYGYLTQFYGIDGVVLHPIQEHSPLDAPTAQFLGSVGLPNDRFFTSRAGITGSQRDPYELGPLFALGDRYCPEESRNWQVLGYLPAALVTLDPASGSVYIFQESERDYQLAHRDVAALVHCLAEFRKLEDGYKASDPDIEYLVDTFREAVNAFDRTPLADPESEWNRMLGEVLEEIW
ncbi:SUKH-4 family immunity protein [Streptomyces sp. NRRL S-118]|uniref:SUKH-4 family immunity protein n=1 Tax=Streptomyces sp. NRRL S-118 TaxID=1463881 RepID=UPI0004C5CC54|nr:SUKH-4 family immunity protein [Streptomyces sp. NRRL S-118]